MRKHLKQINSTKAFRALVVDDTRGSRKLLTTALSRIGVETTEAVDGMAAWKLLQIETFDVVISDYEMPRCSGLQLLAAMRQSISKAIKRLPLIMVSSAESVFLRRQIAETKQSFFLPKPIDLAALRAVLTQLGCGEKS